MTRLQQPALSGNSGTAVICKVNPELTQHQESNITLFFGFERNILRMMWKLMNLLLIDSIFMT